MKHKYVVTTRELHAYEYEVVAESPVEAKYKVAEGKGSPVPQENPCEAVMDIGEWDVRLYAPITATQFPQKGKV
tara:strand:- start:323 stop:544 length:222 start_codon:yes stop_codon:yes gene_type:complete